MYVFLFTDIEQSSRLWEEMPDAMRTALEAHDALFDRCVGENHGKIFKNVGDGICAVFDKAGCGVQAALSAQLELTVRYETQEIPFRVRMGLHMGDAVPRGDDYFGPALNRVARLMALAAGGQTLLSATMVEALTDGLPSEASLKDLGLHRLRDLQHPEQLFQLCHPKLPEDFRPLPSMDALPNNLPPQLTTFIGREKELGEVVESLATTRLVTLTGSGGCGKTRLALQAGAELLEQYTNGVWIVELAALNDPSLIVQSLANALSVREEIGSPLQDTVMRYLKDKKALLIFDNCEHLLEAVAKLGETILRACPNVRLLATSREALGLPGEVSYRIPSLSAPSESDLDDFELIAANESVRLFVDRVALSQSGFQLAPSNATAIAQICRRLDGIPLAIELAAARAKALAPEQIASRLDDAFRILTGGSRTALPRQQTLRATIEWSYNLLSDQEKLLLDRLSVFAGSFSLEAVEKICTDG